MNHVDLIAASEYFQTPMYIFDMDEFDSRLSLIRDSLSPRAELCFAMKANPMLIQRADRTVSRFEVCSPGEFAICMESGIDPEKIVYSGVYKDPDSTKKVVGIIAGRGCATAESAGQLNLLDECAGRTGKKMDVIIRVTSGNQFGIDPDDVKNIIKERDFFRHLNIKGFQLYSGTQKRKIRTIEKELARLDELIAVCSSDYGFQTAELEYGPGLPVNYFADDAFAEEEMLRDFSMALRNMKYKGHISVEMGRFAAASCGSYLTSVGDVKTNKGQNCIITDGGNHQMKYFGQNMGMRTPCFEFLKKSDPDQKTDLQKNSRYNVYGALCTVHDVIAADLALPDPQPGDLFVFKNTGAYSVTEGMALFLSRDIPLVLSYNNKEGFKIMRERLFAAKINCVRQR